MTLRVAVAGIPGAWSTERLSAALREAGLDSFTLSLGDCLHELGSDQVWLGKQDLGALDGLVVKKLAPQDNAASGLRVHLLRALERRGVRVFSPADTIALAMDRYGMNARLAAAGLPLPRTLSLETAAGLREALETLGDAVIKPVFTSKGRGMVRLRAGMSVLPGWDDESGRWLAQKFVQAPGRDIGACVLGEEFVGAFYRVAAEGQWMTTTMSGGRYEPCELSADGREIAIKAARLFSLDYTVVDLVEGDGGYLLYEVSAFGGFSGLKTASGLDVASLYAQNIKKELTR
jgi:ribosomal protein S6--L-glutamate ligase